MKRTRCSSAAASKAPPPKRGTRHQPKSGGEDQEDLGVTEGQLDRITDKVGQRLAKSLAAEGVSAIASQAVSKGASPHAGDANTAPLPQAPAPPQEQVAETAVHALMYG